MCPAATSDDMNTSYVPGCYLLQQMSSHVTLFFKW